jgi:putative methionine-R-sulfoxide reductase with GAF domain
MNDMNESSQAGRPYKPLAQRLRRTPAETGTPTDRFQHIVDVLWDGLHDRGVSWVGFYLPAPDARSLNLGPHRDKPACSPIGLNGVCGWCLINQRARVVRDVRTLGGDYVACDPRDRSEVVVPVFDEAGRVRAVLDLDSFEVGAFDDSDVAGLKRILAASLGSRAVEPPG